MHAPQNLAPAQSSQQQRHQGPLLVLNFLSHPMNAGNQLSNYAMLSNNRLMWGLAERISTQIANYLLQKFFQNKPTGVIGIYVADPTVGSFVEIIVAKTMGISVPLFSHLSDAALEHFITQSSAAYIITENDQQKQKLTQVCKNYCPTLLSLPDLWKASEHADKTSVTYPRNSPQFLEKIIRLLVTFPDKRITRRLIGHFVQMRVSNETELSKCLQKKFQELQSELISYQTDTNEKGLSQSTFLSRPVAITDLSVFNDLRDMLFQDLRNEKTLTVPAAQLAAIGQEANTLLQLFFPEVPPAIFSEENTKSHLHLLSGMEKHVEQHPHNAAIRFSNSTSLTYIALHEQTNQLATYLISHGLVKNNGVGVFLDPSPELIITIIAIIKAGGFILPLDPFESDEIFLERFKQSIPTFIIGDTKNALRRFDRMLATNELPIELIALKEIQSTLADCSKQTSSYNTDPDCAVYASFDKRNFPAPQCTPISQIELQKMLENLQRAMPSTSKDRIAQFNSISSEDSLMEILLALHTGACVVPIPPIQRQNLKKLYAYYDSHEITVGIFSSQLLVTLDENELTTVRGIISDNANLTAEDKTRFCRENTESRRVFVHYAECCSSMGVYLFSVDNDPHCFPLPSDNSYSLLENDEVFIKHTKPNFYSLRFREQALLRTYQRGKIEKGKLFLVGNTASRVSLKHTALYLDDIRFFLKNFPGIEDSYPVCKINPTLNLAEITIYIELKPNVAVDSVDGDILKLDQLFRQFLPENFRVKQCILVNRIFSTVNGDIDLSQMENILTSKQFLKVFSFSPIEPQYPQTTVEKTLEKAWQDSLGYPYPISLSTPLSQVGATLLTWRRVCETVSEIEELRHLETMEPEDFQTHPTLRGMVRFVKQKSHALPSVIPVVLAEADANASSTPCFMIPSFMGESGKVFKGLTKHWKKSRRLLSFDFSAMCDSNSLPETIKEFAEEIIRGIKKIQPSGPYLIASFQNNSTAIATEVILQLQARGETAGVIILLATPSVSGPNRDAKELSVYLKKKYVEFCRLQNIAQRPLFPEGKAPTEQIEIISRGLRPLLPKNKYAVELMRAMLLAQLNYTFYPPLASARHIFIKTDTFDEITYLNVWQENNPGHITFIPCSEDDFLETSATLEAFQQFLTELELDFKTIAITAHLRARYTSEAFAFIHRLFADNAHARAPIDEAFTELKLLPENEKTPEKKNESDDDAENPTEEDRPSVHLHTIFEGPASTPIKRVLVLGKPGTGKTTLAQRMVYLHASGKLFTHLFESILLFKLRRFTSVNYDPRKQYTLADIFQRECLSQTGLEGNFSLEEVTRYLINLKGRVCILLEGLDELPGNSPLLPLIYDLFNDQAVTIIAFARPEARFRCQEVRFDVTVENTGFSDQDIPTYVRQYYAPDKKGDETAKKVIDYLTKNSALYGVAHYPLYLELICTVWDASLEKEISTDSLTLTKLCEKIQEKLWKRYFENQRYHNKALARTKQNTSQFLEKVAFLAMEQHQVIISNALLTKVAKEIYRGEQIEKNEDFDLIIDEILAPGFLASSDNDQDLSSKNYYFLHYSLHEFFAAQYFVRWFTNTATRHDATVFLARHKYNPRYQLFWQFVAGLFASQQPEMLQVFFDALNIGEIDCIGIYHFNLVIRCLEETQNSASITQQNEILSIVQKLINENVLDAQLLSTLRNCPSLLKKFKISEQLQKRIQDKGANRGTYSLDKVSIIKFACKLSFLDISLLECIFAYFTRTDEREKVYIIKGFRKLRQHFSAVADFMADYLKDPSAEVRAHAHGLLGKLQRLTPRVLKSLQVLTEDLSEAQAVRAIKTLGAIGEAQLPVLEVLKRKLSSSNGEIRLACLTALSRLKPLKADTVFVIEKMIMDMDSVIRKKAIELRAKLPVYTKRFVSLLVTSLLDNANEVANEAAKTLTMLRRVNPALLSFLCRKYEETSNPVFRQHILRALPSLIMLNRHIAVPPQVVAIFHKAFSDPDFGIFNSAITCGPLEIIPNHQLIAMVIDAIEKKQINMMRSFQLHGMPFFNLSEEDETQLMNAVRSPDADVRMFASQSLQLYKQLIHNDMSSIETQLKSEDPDEVKEAIELVWKQSEKDISEEIMRTLCSLLCSPTEEIFRASLGALQSVCHHTPVKNVTSEIIRTICELIPQKKETAPLFRLLAIVASPTPELFGLLAELFTTLAEEDKQYMELIKQYQETFEETQQTRDKRIALSKSTGKKRQLLVNLLCTLVKNWDLVSFTEYLKKYNPDKTTLKKLCEYFSLDIIFQLYFRYPRKAFLIAVIQKIYFENSTAIYISNHELCCFDPLFRLAITDQQADHLRKQIALAFEKFAKLKPEFFSFGGSVPLQRSIEATKPLIPAEIPASVGEQRKLASDLVFRQKLTMIGDQVRQTGKRTIFISHAWQLSTDEDRKLNLNELWSDAFVKQLAEDLRLLGFTVILDFSDLGTGVRLNAAMEASVEKADHILIMATRTYFHKLENRVLSGVGKELNLIASRVNALTPKKTHEMRLLHCFNFVGKFPPAFTLFESYDGFAAISINDTGYLTALLELPAKIAGVKSNLAFPPYSNATLLAQFRSSSAPHKTVPMKANPSKLAKKTTPKKVGDKRPLPPPPQPSLK